MWKSILINKNFVEGKNYKRFLFRFPRYSKYDGCNVIISNKLVHDFNSKLYRISYRDEFEFIVEKGFNEFKIDGAELCEGFNGGFCEIIHTPKNMTPVESVIDEDLLDE